MHFVIVPITSSLSGHTKRCRQSERVTEKERETGRDRGKKRERVKTWEMLVHNYELVIAH